MNAKTQGKISLDSVVKYDETLYSPFLHFGQFLINAAAVDEISFGAMQLCVNEETHSWPH